MAGYQTVILNGDAGDSWTNRTDRVYYQLFVNWYNTCGLCAQYDHAVRLGNWPIPFHRGCNCRQQAIKPGATADPWSDYRAEIAGLDPAQQAKVVGASNYKLIIAGKVQWSDVVTQYRVRDLNEVVAIKNLDVKSLLNSGVRRDVAESAYRSVHTPAHELVAAQRSQLLSNLNGAGLSTPQVREIISVGLATRITAVGPNGGRQTVRLPGRSDADLIRSYLAMWIDQRPKPPKPQPSTTPKPSEPTPKVEPPIAAAAPPVQPAAAEQPIDVGFASPAQIQAIFMTLSLGWVERLSTSEKRGVRSYTGGNFEAVNDYLRSQRHSLTRKSSRDAIERAVRGVDEALAKASLKSSVVVYRGIEDLKALGLDPTNLRGATVVDKGFLSTSLSLDAADKFADAVNGAILKITAPRGAKGASVEGVTKFADEREVLFARGAKMKVTGVSRRPEDGMPIIEMEMEP